MRLSVWPLCTGASLIVIPFSRSRSMESRICSCILRFSTVPVISSMRSESVDLPWSMWAMIQKLRMCFWSIATLFYHTTTEDNAVFGIQDNRLSRRHSALVLVKSDMHMLSFDADICALEILAVTNARKTIKRGVRPRSGTDTEFSQIFKQVPERYPSGARAGSDPVEIDKPVELRCRKRA